MRPAATRNRRISRAVSCAATTSVLVLLSGCAAGLASWQRPSTQAAPAWRHADVQAGTPVGHAARWWESFADPELDRLVVSSLEGNADLVASAVRVRRAQLQSSLAGTNRTPSVTASAEYTNARDLRRDQTLPKTGTIGLEMTYELDLWGRLLAARSVAEWEAQATEQDREALRHSIAYTTSTLYWTAGLLNERITLSEASIADASRTLELVMARSSAGATSGLEPAQARQTLAALRATHARLLQLRVENLNALNVVLGRPLDAETPVPQRLSFQDLPAVNAGIPAEVIGRRPDLQAAESRLRSSFSNVQATRADFYPRLSLTGSLGSTSTALSELLRNPIGTLGTQLVLPFVQWNTNRLTAQVSEADYEESVARFRQSVHLALSEVENSLSARGRLLEESDWLTQSLDHARQAERIAAVRYRAGATELRSWLDAQEVTRNAQVQLAQNRFDRLANTAALFKALGGDPAVR
ncbi:MAG: efflux transporter outer membrane subunit [Rhizobacter sp.]